MKEIFLWCLEVCSVNSYILYCCQKTTGSKAKNIYDIDMFSLEALKFITQGRNHKHTHRVSLQRTSKQYFPISSTTLRRKSTKTALCAGTEKSRETRKKHIFSVTRAQTNQPCVQENVLNNVILQCNSSNCIQC